MQIKEIRSKSIGELEHDLVELHKKFDDLNFKVRQKQLKNIREIRSVKSTMARILTILKEKKK
jgi:ribosomal protein L29